MSIYRKYWYQYPKMDDLKIQMSKSDISCDRPYSMIHILRAMTYWIRSFKKLIAPQQAFFIWFPCFTFYLRRIFRLENVVWKVFCRLWIELLRLFGFEGLFTWPEDPNISSIGSVSAADNLFGLIFIEKTCENSEQNVKICNKMVKTWFYTRLSKKIIRELR